MSLGTYLLFLAAGIVLVAWGSASLAGEPLVIPITLPVISDAVTSIITRWLGIALLAMIPFSLAQELIYWLRNKKEGPEEEEEYAETIR